ncbi:aldolase/citrate lyase family protein [Methylophilaceae bacterium]|jgi:citrate lyase subunit beta/citryl-CoA lyase|uniref:CitE n=1 Tax=Methylophilales bacterium HTCC2181 TaxID=383631 RepID=A0P6P8_9PROT|nr:CitE [Methylophilales bacterium HTCC2181]MBT3513654.1 HpcH/HpaI aldolase/citrate lyase family protein [Nitrosomonadales bacterium]MDA9086082.1 aldolase/citrate lyase family protein [Methylophilaceae bacterium]MBT5410930.1 HpcH/HpaI aldolase/citrate lyase family protein [Nitrosomonadales bacterium]MDB9717068.1 aldolase/citrate lyase family protein [Methylophilaceae bacterium]|tara:strand:+ start:1285 stop:2421 length:1137 start_codon:yes stop_codon:yes gene_type:complete
MKKEDALNSTINTLNVDLLGDLWPGIQLYYPPVKYSPSSGVYESIEAASLRMKKHAYTTEAHTLIFDLEDGCRKKEMSRELMLHELPLLRANRPDVAIAIRVNSFKTVDYEFDMQFIEQVPDCVDAVMLAKAGEVYGASEIKHLTNHLNKINPSITIQPIIEHPKSLKIAPDLMSFDSVKHVVFGIHDFSKAMGINITPTHWIDELSYFLNELMFEARISGKGVIGGVETLIGGSSMPSDFLEQSDVRRWLDLHGDEESRIVYRHAVKEREMGLTGKQVIHPSHIHLCKVAYTPSPTDIALKVKILEAAVEADALLGGAIKFNGEMLDPPMFGKALQTLLRAYALGALKEGDVKFTLSVLNKLPEQVIRQNWPYGNPS